MVAFGEGAIGLESVNWGGVLLFLGALALMRLRRLNPILVMALCGALGIGLYALGLG